MTEPVRLPIDNDAREAIYHRLDHTLFVTAGAGSGKTHALVQRIAGLVRSGVPLKRVAAITFTNSAAAELRDRVRGELESLADKADALTAAEIEYVEDALSSIDAGAIQTLHSFAQRLVSLFPLESGLPPEIEVRDEVAASIAFEDRWQPFTEQLMQDGLGDPEVAAALLHGTNSGLTARHLRNVAVCLHREWDRVLDVEFPCPPMPKLDPSAVIAAMEEVESLLGDILPGRETTDLAYGPLVSLVKPLDALRSSWATLKAATTENERLAMEERIFWLLKPNFKQVLYGRKAYWRGDSLDRAKGAAKAASAAREELLTGIRAACLGPILRALQRFVREYRDERLSLGSLEFYDVLVLARDLLAKNPEVRGRLHGRYEAILIDEFQDTDPLQVELAVLLATEPRTPGSIPWDEAPIPPGRLFFVGDPKQSIYRFRRADIDLYTNAARRFGQQPLGETVLLTQNFRSAPSLIAWVNHVFGELFTLERASGDVANEASQVAFDALTAWREETVPGGVAVRLLGGPVAKTKSGDWQDKTDTMRMRTDEATSIAALIAGIRDDSSAWQVVDEKENTPRDARLADIAILLPTRVTLPEIEKALNERGIPCRVESRSLLFETQEVRDLLIILAAIDDPTDQVAVVSALRSPGFGCSDADIYRFAAAGGSWNYLRDLPVEYPADGLVSLGFAALRDLHARRWWLSIGEMVDAVIRERRLLQVAFTALRPRETWQRLRFVHDQARAFTSAGGRSLRQFVRFMERQAEEQSRVNERAVSEDDDDAVRIMTVHASKGLEFPIVILAGLNSTPLQLLPVLLTTADGGAELRVGNKQTSFETPGYDALAGRERLMERIEDDRVLYVGATRARDHLVVSLYHLRTIDPKGSVEPHADRHRRARCSAAECIYEIAQERPDLWCAAEVAVTEPAPMTARPVTRIDTAADYADWRIARAELIASQSRAPVIAATALAKAGRLLAASDEKAEQSDESAPWKKGRASTSLGRAVHAVLQTIDLATGEGTAEASRAQAIAEGLPARDAEIASLVDAARRSTAVQAAIVSGRYWREVYVATEIDGVMVEGFIDLLYESADGLVVVDYKTDSARDAAAIDASMARYRMQGAAYSLALQESIGRPVAACTFVFIRPEEERNIADLPAAVAEVRALIPLVAGSGNSGGFDNDSPAATDHVESPPPEPPALPPEPVVEVVAPKKGTQLAFDLGA